MAYFVFAGDVLSFVGRGGWVSFLLFLCLFWVLLLGRLSFGVGYRGFRSGVFICVSLFFAAVAAIVVAVVVAVDLTAVVVPVFIFYGV